jgi:ribonuclease Z
MPLTMRFLGTSAALPTSRRGLPGIALKFDGTMILFDCGEGTQRALMEAGWKLSGIRVICLSHLHADHVGGLLGVLTTRELQGVERPLTILGPDGTRDLAEGILKFTQSHVNYDLEITELSGDGGQGYIGDEFTIQWAPLKHRVPTLGYLFLEHDKPGTFNVERAQRLGIKPGPLYGKLKAGNDITLPDGQVVEANTMVGPAIAGRRIAVIWDTRPCPGAYHLAENADLAVFESTFTQAHREEAEASDHCTAAQVAKIAKKSGVRQLILTHISARYQEPEPLLDEARPFFENTQVAEDGLEIEINRQPMSNR